MKTLGLQSAQQMPSPLNEKLKLWTDRTKGFKARFNDGVKEPALLRDDLLTPRTKQKRERGDLLQSARLRYYPSIDVDYGTLFAGKIVGSLDGAVDKLNEMGYRNNPTAYVEVTDEFGADEGSYARQIVTESEVRFDRPIVHSYPTLFRREKRQIHVTVYKVGEEVHFLAHEERSAWLQPARHVAVNDSNARIGVREFRNDWFDEFGRGLGGETDVFWETKN